MVSLILWTFKQNYSDHDRDCDRDHDRDCDRDRDYGLQPLWLSSFELR